MGHHGTWGAQNDQIYGLKATQICGPKSGRFRIYTERFWRKTWEKLMQDNWFFLGSGGILRWKKNSQTTKNSKSSRRDLVFWGIFLSVPNSNVVVSTPRCWFNHGSIKSRIVFFPPNSPFSFFKQKNTARKRHLSKWLVQIPGFLYWLIIRIYNITV